MDRFNFNPNKESTIKGFHPNGLKQSGKSFSTMIQLKENIESGLDCAVATHDPDKIKYDFEYVTGFKLNLENTENDGIYKASIIK